MLLGPYGEMITSDGINVGQEKEKSQNVSPVFGLNSRVDGGVIS